MSGDSALLRLVAFQLDEQRYGLPLHTVERVLPMVAMSSLPGAPAVILGVLDWHGRLVSAVDIRKRFGLPARRPGTSAHLLVARTAHRTLALPVDAVLGVTEASPVAVTPREVVDPGLAHVAGVVASEAGLLFVHDLDALLSQEEEEHLGRALAGYTE